MASLDIAALLKLPEPALFLSQDSSSVAIAEVLIALANNGGGFIVFGLSAGGKPTRLSRPAQTRDRLLEIALACDPPLIIPSPTIQTHNKRPVLIVTVPPDLPHVYSYQGRYLIREAGEIVPLTGYTLRHLIFARGEAGFDAAPHPRAGRDDLNWPAIQTYVSAVEGLRHLSPEEALLKRGCLKLIEGQLTPTNAGLLLFAVDPQKWLPQAELTVVRYSGLQMSDTFIRADIQGTLPEQARRAEAFVLENIGRDVNINALQRAENHLYPVPAVREVIVNALAHRDYSIRGDNIRLLLFANRLECYSPGRLPGHITVKNILRERFSRNATLVQGLFDMGFIERLGYGIDRIIRGVAEAGLPNPDFTETAAGFKITLYNNVRAQAEDQNAVRQWLEMGLNNRQITALNYVAEHGRITNAEYQSLCADVSPETLRRDLADLVKRNILLKIGEKRATFYILK